MTVLRFTTFIFFGLLFSNGHLAGSVRAETVEDWLEYPPAFQLLFGNPEVRVKRHPIGVETVSLSKTGVFTAGKGFDKTPTRSVIRVTAGATASDAEVRSLIAKGLANRFFSKVVSQSARNWNEKKLNMDELVEMNRGIFLDLAGKRLTGVPVADPVLNAWWDVRMGNRLKPRRDHHLVIINIHYDYKGEKESAGHFCFALRERGGDPDGDVLFDFRAPWREDRVPRVTEAVNIHNRLKLKAFTENLYDWIYTQTEYRNCYVNLWFLPVMEEQKILLDNFAASGEPHQAGSFRVFRKNCASLGLRFYGRIQAFSNPAPHGGLFSDMPVLAAARIVDQFENAPMLVVPNLTDKRGRTPTARSKVRQALPSRAGSPGFKILAAEPEVN
ncbi:MAG: hypothetical protein P1U86_01005 [Verrucomicrobiales bacterium]|nr:hypothetical protein [Verrucomicrobiales bacterium]